EGKAIRFGLSAIKNVGQAAIAAILSARKESGFTSLTECLLKVETSKVNKKVLESLIKAGAFDRFGKRSALLESLPVIKDKISRLVKGKGNGQGGLFDGLDSGSNKIELKDQLPDIPELPMPDLLKFEKQLLGFYLTHHPAKDILKLAGDRVTHRVSQLDPSYHLGQTVTLAGILSSVREVNTKKNNSRMAFATLEDDTSTVDLVIFPKLFAKNPSFWQEEKALLVTGKVDNRDSTLSILVDEVEEIDPNQSLPDQLFEIDIPRGTPKEILVKINELLKSYPGKDRIIILIPNGGPPKRLTLPYTVNYTEELKLKVNKLIH
ncbi:hypothetical protein HY333_01500, partial [Candidatus Collierbacteria bacterium]|nr:hypothetical protein [Candidatus Collierbacteria bacterium]